MIASTAASRGCVIELVHHVAVGVEGESGAVTELSGDVVNGAPLMQKQRGEAVAKVVWDRAGQADAAQQAGEGRSRQLSQVVLVQWRPSWPGKISWSSGGAAGRHFELAQVGGERLQEADGAGLMGLGGRDVAGGDGAFDRRVRSRTSAQRSASASCGRRPE